LAWAWRAEYEASDVAEQVESRRRIPAAHDAFRISDRLVDRHDLRIWELARLHGASAQRIVGVVRADRRR
jgi:hypothetical protein